MILFLQRILTFNSIIDIYLYKNKKIQIISPNSLQHIKIFPSFVSLVFFYFFFNLKIKFSSFNTTFNGLRSVLMERRSWFSHEFYVRHFLSPLSIVRKHFFSDLNEGIYMSACLNVIVFYSWSLNLLI